MRSALVKSRALPIRGGGGITRRKGRLHAQAPGRGGGGGGGGGGWCGVAIRQVSPKQAIGPAGTAPIKTFDPRAAWQGGGIKRPNSP